MTEVIGDYVLVNGGSATVGEERMRIAGPGAIPKTPCVLRRQLAAPEKVVAIRVSAQHVEGRHRLMFVSFGSSASPDSLVVGGVWTGIGRNSIIQYSGLDKEAVDQHNPAVRFALPNVDQPFDITMRIDCDAKRVSLVVAGCDPVERDLKIPLDSIDYVGVAVRGATEAEFKHLTVFTGAKAAGAAIQEAAAQAGQRGAADGVMRAPEAGPARGLLVSQASADLATTADSVWTDRLKGDATGILALEDQTAGSVLSVDVQSRARLFLRDKVSMRPGMVYRFDIMARIVGQVEQVGARMDSRDFRPIQWPLHRDWAVHSVQVRARGGEHRLQLTFSGVGRFQIREVTISELPTFELPAVTTPERGELLRNGAFQLDDLNWTLRYPKREAGATAPQARNLQVALGDAGLQLPAGERSLLTSASPLVCQYGRSYTIRVQGAAEAGDIDAILIRPGMAAVDTEVFPLTFVDGVAEHVYRLLTPEQGMVARPEEHFGLRLRHRGHAAATISSVAFCEGTVDTAAVPEVGIRLGVGSSQCEAVAVLGEPVLAQVVTAGLSDGTTLTLDVCDEQGSSVLQVPVQKGIGPWPHTVDVALDALPLGWFHVSAVAQGETVAVVGDDLAVILPADPTMQRNGFLGTHLGRLNTRQQVELISSLGIKHVRLWDADWATAQPNQGDPFAFPVSDLEVYRAAGIEPMLVLSGTPDWASSAPQNMRQGWHAAQKFPPNDLADWAAYIRAVVAACGDQVDYYEIWNEPNGHWMQKAPTDPRSLEEIYADLVRIAYPIIKQGDPDATVVIGACAGHPSFTVRSMQRHGIADSCDAISYHAYGGANFAGQGLAAFSFTQDYLARTLPELGRADLPIYDSESGIKDLADGVAGFADAMILAQGLIARQASGMQRYYFYNAVPREYPGHQNFSLLFGFDGRPLVTVPMIATWDRVLGNAQFGKDLAPDDKDVHVFRFDRADGHPVVAYWSTAAVPEDIAAPAILGSAVCLDFFGRRVPLGADGRLPVSGHLRYAIPEALPLATSSR
ncbi:MAG: hypothetical protein PF961_21390 [Planctomycetota bacterium]|nr:hypothetical protein [Planctomycetota bacterium]